MVWQGCRQHRNWELSILEGSGTGIVHSEFFYNIKEFIFGVSPESPVTKRFCAPKPPCVPDKKFVKTGDTPFFPILVNDKI
jgi:hypothetical protein